MTTIDAPALTAHDSASDSAQKWVAVARSLASLVESEVPQSAKDTIVTSKVVQAWKDAGLYKLLLPARLGGKGLHSVSFLHVAEEVARQTRRPVGRMPSTRWARCSPAFSSQRTPTSSFSGRTGTA